jgi:hypothetical protein
LQDELRLLLRYNKPCRGLQVVAVLIAEREHLIANANLIDANLIDARLIADK